MLGINKVLQFKSFPTTVLGCWLVRIACFGPIGLEESCLPELLYNGLSSTSRLFYSPFLAPILCLPIDGTAKTKFLSYHKERQDHGIQFITTGSISFSFKLTPERIKTFICHGDESQVNKGLNKMLNSLASLQYQWVNVGQFSRWSKIENCLDERFAFRLVEEPWPNFLLELERRQHRRDIKVWSF